MSASRRAVITGMGLACPLGLDLPTIWDRMIRGESSVGPIRQFDVSGLPVRFAGEVTDFDPNRYLEKKERKNLRVMARTIKLAVAAAQMALDNAAVDKAKLDPTRFGVEFGAGLIATELDELGTAAQSSVNGKPGNVDLEHWGELGIPTIQPLWMLKYLPNMLSCHVSILHNAQGPSNTITESDVASLLALGESFRILARDRADFFLVGGGESRLNPLSLVRQCLFQTLSQRNEEPARACRPFDLDRDGMVLGEGAGVFAVEELEHARRRGATILAEIVGFGAAFDRKHDGQGLVRAMRAALADAGIAPDQVDHINAHGASSKLGDAIEARAIAEVFSGIDVPAFAPKSFFGNIGAGSGITELATSVLALRRGLLPGSLNHEKPDPDCPIRVHTGEPRPVVKTHVVKIGTIDQGQCAAVVLRRWDE